MRPSQRSGSAVVMALLLASASLAQPRPEQRAREALDAMASSLIERPDLVELLDEPTVRDALRAVDDLLESEPSFELRAELLYRRAMLRLEPLPTYDARAAREDLEQAIGMSSAWEAAARYALGWMQEVGGQVDLAFDVYRRLEVDHPASDAAAWADVGRARMRLRSADYGTAAARLQRALDAGLDDRGVRRLRELAVAGLMRQVGASDPSTARAFETGIRAPIAMLATPAGGVVLATRRPAEVVLFAENGARTDEWSIEGLQALAISPAGRLLAAGTETIFRLENAGRSVPIAELGEFKALAAIAAAVDGSVWLLEGRGRRLGHLRPGAARPELVREDERWRLNGLLADGSRLLALDSRSRALIAFESDGAERVMFDGTGRRLESLAVDPSGRIALLDSRNSQVVFVSPSGRAEPPLDARQYLEESRALALGPRGELMLLDGKGRCVAVR